MSAIASLVSCPLFAGSVWWGDTAMRPQEAMGACARARWRFHVTYISGEGCRRTRRTCLVIQDADDRGWGDDATFRYPQSFHCECPDGMRSSTELSLEFGYTSHYQAGAGGPARPLLSTIHVPSASPTCAAAPAALPWGGAGCKLRAHFRACDVFFHGH
jgi:hypothetical protein